MELERLAKKSGIRPAEYMELQKKRWIHIVKVQQHLIELAYVKMAEKSQQFLGMLAGVEAAPTL